MRRALSVLCLVAAALAVPSFARAQPEPVTWCGSDEVGQNRVPDLELAAPQQVRFVYAVPADGADNFGAVASGIATDASWIDSWWETQDPTRTPRVDRYPFPGCTTKYGGLDIGFVRLPSPAATYAAPDNPSLRLDDDLARAFPLTEKTIVYFDGPITSRTVCGATDYLANTQGGNIGIVYVYLQSNCDLGAPGAGGTAEVAAHELLHNLGAVPGAAPNECAASDSHACDSTSDIMYPFLGDASTLDSVVLDVNRDDYYGHSGTWWDVQDSDWLTHLPQFPFSLAVAGSGRLVSQLPCEDGCSDLQLDNGEKVTVYAVPGTGWKFSSWSGGCSSSPPSCTLEIDGPTSATATFVKAPLRIRVSISGRGRVTSSPARIACPGACAATFTGARARLQARPAAGWRFAGWSGACHGVSACMISAAGSVRARFTRR